MRRMRAPFALTLVTLIGGATAASAQEPERPPRAPEPEKECACEFNFGESPMRWTTLLGQRVMLGISMSMDANEEGVRVEEVLEDSPAAEAGLQEGDIITGIAGQDLTEPMVVPEDEPHFLLYGEETGTPQWRLRQVLSDLEADEPVDITYLRDGNSVTGTIVPRARDGGAFAMAFGPENRVVLERLREMEDLHEEGGTVFRYRAPQGAISPKVWVGPEGERSVIIERDRAGEPRIEIRTPDGVRAAPRVETFGLSRIRAGEGPCGTGHGVVISESLGCIDGVQMIALNPGLGEYFGVEEGVLISDASEENTLGLQSGDVLLSVDGREVRDPGHAARILSSYEQDEEVSLRVRRQDRETTVSGTRSR